MYNIKIALRNLLRNGLYSGINIAGLAVSLTAVIFILFWVNDELSFDRFHRNADRIYRVTPMMDVDEYWTTTPAPLAAAAIAEMPEIEKSCRIAPYRTSFWEYEGKKFFSLEGAAVDKSFFEMFDFDMIEMSFTDEMSMIISETQAKKLFGDDDPIGKIVKSSDSLLFHITGVMKDMPRNSSLRYDYLIPFAVQQLTFGGNGNWKTIEEDWGSYICYTCFLLRPDAGVEALSEKLGKMVTRLRRNESTRYEDREYNFILQALPKIHLYNLDEMTNGMKTIGMLSIIAFLILAIACINYVNLITARALKRSREISVRKIVGGKRLTLVWQLMSETLLLFFVALALSTLFIKLLFPWFNRIVEKEMTFNFFSSQVLTVYGLVAAGMILLAGVYPAIHLSSFKPLDVFRGGSTGQGKHIYLRKSLVVLQFFCSFGLIMATVVIGLQLHYMRNKDLGYNKENVFTVRMRAMTKHYEAVKNELMQNTNIVDISGAIGSAMYPGIKRGGTDWDGKNQDNDPYIYEAHVSDNFLQMMNIPLVSGEYLSEGDVKYMLVNEKAVKLMGMNEPLGKNFWLNKGREQDRYIIKGIIRDYNFEDLTEPVKPMVVITTDIEFQYFGCLYVKTVPGGEKNAVEAVEKIWKQYNPDYEFAYSFLDDEFDRIYKSDLLAAKLLYIFAFIAIFVSCLGLFGLVTFTAESKTKEIGIRKVLGASVTGIVNMLLREFLILIGIAVVLALPLTYYLLNRMLQDYAYRIDISWWMFALAASVTISLTLLTVGWQAIKIARANPVKSIKTE